MVTARGAAYTPWGSLVWNHASCNRYGWAGKCIHCGGNAMLKHPITNKPCHKACQDRIDGADYGG